MKTINPERYEYLWSNFEVNFLFVSCYLSPMFREADIVLTYDCKKHELKYFLAKKDRKRIEKLATARYQSGQSFNEWKYRIGEDINIGERLVTESETDLAKVRNMHSKELREKVLERAHAFQELVNDYFYTEFFAVSGAEKLAHDGPDKYRELQQRIEEMSQIRFRVREVLNKFYNYRITFQPYTKEIAKRSNRSDIEWLRFDEIAEVAESKSIPASRRDSQNWILAKRLGWEVISGEAAQELIRDFDSFFSRAKNDLLSGTIANKGVYCGTVKVLRVVFSDMVSAEIRKVEKGDVVVASTTGPEVISACQRAGAIVTDQSGLTSHAAIISRELNIPCIVGTRFATQVLKDGDLVEVDAERGIVTILKKAS